MSLSLLQGVAGSISRKLWRVPFTQRCRRFASSSRRWGWTPCQTTTRSGTSSSASPRAHPWTCRTCRTPRPRTSPWTLPSSSLCPTASSAFARRLSTVRLSPTCEPPCTKLPEFLMVGQVGNLVTLMFEALPEVKPQGLDAVKWLANWLSENNPNNDKPAFDPPTRSKQYVEYGVNEDGMPYVVEAGVGFRDCLVRFQAAFRRQELVHHHSFA